MIGVSYGAPTEFRSNGAIIEGNLNKYLDWTPERLRNAIDQDDLYVEMTFAIVKGDAEREVLGAVAVARDVTERVERERAASRSS